MLDQKDQLYDFLLVLSLLQQPCEEVIEALYPSSFLPFYNFEPQFCRYF